MSVLSIMQNMYSQDMLPNNIDSLLTFEKQIDLIYDNRTEQSNIYAISQIKAEDMTKTTSFNSFDSWTGRLSGYYYNQIRGLSSTNQGPILILLDGFQSNVDFINNMDIEEIESITIMKDAPATALFGLGGANGIISIKTKRGYIGKPVIKVAGTYGLQTITDKPQFYNTYDYTGLYNEALVNDGMDPIYIENQRNRYPNTDWYKEALKNYAPLAKVDFSIRGGNQRIKYFVHLNYFNKQGFFKNTNLNEDYSTQEIHNRANFRSNFDIQLFNKTNIKVDIGGFLYDLNSPRHSNYEIFDILQTVPPIIQGKYEDGMYGGSATYRNNPLAMISNAGYSKRHQRAFNFKFLLTQDLDIITDGLRFNGAVNIMNWGLYGDNWVKDYMTQNREGSSISSYGFEGSLSYGTWFTQLRSMGTDLYLDYNKSWDESTLTGLLGFRFSTETASGRNQNIARIGSYGKISYSNQNKYFADLVLGYNGSQNFAPGKRFGLFPALALGWLISEEKNFNNIDLLKLRTSIGLTGSDYVEDAYKFMYFQSYQWTTGYNTGNDNSSQGGIDAGMLAYPNAKWENSLKSNIGLDLGLWNHLKIGFDLFSDYRYDILVSRTGKVPSLIGIELPYDNKGKVLSYGFETTLDYEFGLKDFTFNLGGFFNFNKSKIIEMNEIPRPYSYLERTNKSVGQYFGLQTNGFFQDQADIDNSPQQLYSNYRTGDIKYVDQNSDNIIDDFDEIAIGKSWFPEIVYAFNPSISYKNFTLEVLFQGVAGRSIFLNTSQFWGFYNQRNITTNAVEGRWTEDTRNNATLPRLSTLSNANNYRLNDLWLANGNFLKLRNLEIRYDFPKKLLSSLKISRAQIFFRGNNLFSFDHIKDADPENLGPEPTISLKNIGFILTF